MEARGKSRWGDMMRQIQRSGRRNRKGDSKGSGSFLREFHLLLMCDEITRATEGAEGPFWEGGQGGRGRELTQMERGYHFSWQRDGNAGR